MSTTRRSFLAASGTAAALALSTRLPGQAYAESGVDKAIDDPFTLGVASGDPLPDAVVIWTRLAPDPLDSRGGMPQRNRPVQWQVASDERFRRVVRSGTATARPEYGHSVHVDVGGLDANREYFYRFREGRHVSRIGRTKTAPTKNAKVNRLRFAYASCAHYAHGFFTAYRHLSEEDVDFFFLLGDYIYDSRLQGDIGRKHAPDQKLLTLDDFRIRHAQYKADADLQAAQAAFACIPTWDDHEVGNNYSSGADQLSEENMVLRANGYRAYWENMPLRIPAPQGPDVRLYRQLRFGRLAEFNLLDVRQYRSPTGDRDDPSRMFLGDEQRGWLLDRLGASTASWNVLAQQQLMAKADSDPGPGEKLPSDNWNGYEPARQRLFDGIVERGVEDVIVLSGDAHCHVVSDLKLDFDDPDSQTIGTEFLGTSISSSSNGGAPGADGADMDPKGEGWMASNPHMRFYSGRRGYATCVVTPQLWTTTCKTLDYVRRPGSPIRTAAAFAVEHGVPGVQTA